MKEEFHYNFKDIFTCAKKGFSMKKIMVGMKGGLLAFLVYLVLSYIVLLIDGNSFGEIWNAYHYCPVALGANNVFASIISILNWVLVFCIVLITATAISRITLKELQGDVFYEGKEGINFAKKNWKSVILSPIGLFLFIIFLLICAIIVGLIGRIPYAGELLTTPFTLFYFAAGLLVVFFAIVLFLSLILVPVAVATTEADFFDALFETFSTVIKQFWRFLLYRIIAMFMTYIGVTILGIGSFLSLGVIRYFCGIGMGEKLVEIAGVSFKYLPLWWMDFFSKLIPFNILGKIYSEGIEPFYWGFRGTDLPWSGDIAAFIVGISLNLVVLFILAYGLSALVAGDTMMFIALKKRMDDEDLLEVPEEEEDEIQTFEEEEEEETEEPEESEVDVEIEEDTEEEE